MRVGALFRSCRGLSSASNLSDELKTSFSYCVDLVRTHDYENYLWTMQLAKDLRPSVLALRAYNVETALIAERVQKGGAMLREMRFKWWHDAINAIYRGSPPDHPVVIALSSTVNRVHLTRYRVKKITSTRADDAVRQGPIQTVSSLEAYVDGTTGQLMLLQLEAAGCSDVEACEAAQFGARAVGIVNLLRGSIHHAQLGHTYLPLDLCEAHGEHPSILLKGKNSPGITRVVEELCTRATDSINQARALAYNVPKPVRGLLLPIALADMHLQSLKQRKYNVLDPDWNRKGVLPFWIPLALKYKMLVGKY